MSTVARLFGAVFALCLLVSAHGRANGPEAFDLRYAMDLGGWHVADARLRYEGAPAAYRSRLSVETVGLADLIAGYRGLAWSEGQRSVADGLQPRAYGFSQSSHRASRTAKVTFDPETGSAIEAESTKRGKPDRIEVPPELWDGAIDPLTAFLRLRRALAEVRREGEPLSARIFDGRRLYDARLMVLGREMIRIGEREIPALHAELRLEPIAGFDDGDDAAFRLETWLSVDGAFVPLRVRTLGTAITAVFRLEKRCSEQDRCRLVGAES